MKKRLAKLLRHWAYKLDPPARAQAEGKSSTGTTNLERLAGRTEVSFAVLIQ
jgi:hypothetical protein